MVYLALNTQTAETDIALNMITLDTINLLASSNVAKGEYLSIFDQKLVSGHGDGLVPLPGLHNPIQIIKHNLFLAMRAGNGKQAVIAKNHVDMIKQATPTKLMTTTLKPIRSMRLITANEAYILIDHIFRSNG